MGADEEPLDSGSSTKKEHQEERRRAAADRVKLRNEGLTTRGKVGKDLRLRELLEGERAGTAHPHSAGRFA